MNSDITPPHPRFGWLAGFALTLSVVLSGPTHAGNTNSEQKDIRWGSAELAAAIPIEPGIAPVLTGRAGLIRMTLPQSILRPGERYLEAVLERKGDDSEGLSWQVEVVPTASSQPQMHSSSPVKSARALVQFDARTSGEGILRVRLMQGEEEQDVVEAIFRVEQEKTLGEYQQPEVKVDRGGASSSAAEAWITFGFPLPRGAVWQTEGLQLLDAEGEPQIAQFHPRARWNEAGSYKWLRVDAFTTSSGPLRVAATEENQSQDRTGPTLKFVADGKAVNVDTGVATYRIEPSSALLNHITRDGKVISQTGESQRGLFVVDQKGRLGQVDAETTEIVTEWLGPLAGCLRVSGAYRSGDGEELARFTAWLEFAAGRPECRITHHLVLTRNTNEVWFKEIGWELGLKSWTARSALWAAERGKTGSLPALEVGEDAVRMAQIRHRRYGGDQDEFEIGSEGATRITPGEMGDWVAALGTEQGLMIGCREAARQHPKALIVGPDFIRLDLFHGGTGEELDFRSPALVKRWNAGGVLGDKLAGETSELTTNAVGWSKTHFLEICPLTTEDPESLEASALAAGQGFAFPVTALASPEWTYQTEVAGPLYPRDRKRFPEAEAFIDEAFAYWESEQEIMGEYGFVDFFAGPHHTRGLPQGQGRFRASYTLRNAFWLLYLRSGEAKFREMASWTNRVYLDSYLAGWDGPDRIRGLYIHSVGTNDPFASLPFYWEGFTRPGMGTHTNLNQFLFDYYLTGNPRARDGVLAYAEGVKRWWKTSQSDWRILSVLRAVNQAYSLTWDPELRLMQESILNLVYDPDSPVLLTSKGRPYESSTYKTQEDLAGLIEGWELHGTPRYGKLATAVSQYWWNALEPGTRFERGRSGRFLWGQSGDNSVAQRLWNAVRTETTLPPGGTSAEAAFRFQGIPYALSAIVQSDVDRAPVASWAGAEVLTGQAGLILRKPSGEAVKADLLFDRDGWLEPPHIAALGATSQIGPRLLSLLTGYKESVRLGIPAEVEPMDLFIALPDSGAHQAFLHDTTPLLLFANGWWKPSPEIMDPPARIYFQVPEGSQNPSIQFERETRLFAPGGQPWPDAKAVMGKIALPADQPGIWSFSPAQSGAVRASQLPPWFSFDRAEAFFPIEQDRIPLPAAAKRPLVPQGQSLPTGSTLTIEGKKISLPFQEGTIEFFFKPSWDSFGIGDGVRRKLMGVATGDQKDWSLRYVVDSSRGGWPGHPWSRSHVLEVEIETIGPARTRALCVRRTIMEEGEWMHVAISWGQRLFGHSAARTMPAFDVKLFINGVEGKFATWPRQGNQVASPPVSLTLGPDMDGEIADLRISGINRYTTDFPVPSAEEIKSDPDTLLFYAFEKGVSGVDARGKTVPKAVIKNP